MESKSESWLSTVLLLSVSGALLLWLLASPQWIARTVKGENDMIVRAIGTSLTAEVTSRAQSWVALTDRYLLKRKSTAAQPSRWMQDRGETGRWLLFQFFQRVSLLVVWLFLLGPLLLASLVDGFVVRQKRKCGDEYVNPVRFNLGFHLAHAIFLFPLIYVVVPLPVHPWIIFLWVSAMALAIRTIAANLHYRI